MDQNSMASDEVCMHRQFPDNYFHQCTHNSLEYKYLNSYRYINYVYKIVYVIMM